MFRRSNRKISPSQRLPTPRRPRSGRSVTSPTRLLRSVSRWPPGLQTDCSDARTACAAFAVPRDGIYDTVVLTHPTTKREEMMKLLITTALVASAFALPLAAAAQERYPALTPDQLSPEQKAYVENLQKPPRNNTTA